MLLTGGASRLPGLRDRLQSELNQFPGEPGCPDKGPGVMVQGAEHRFLTWAGGALYAKHLDEHGGWITKDMFMERGGRSESTTV